MGIRIGIGRILLASSIIIGEEMKYAQTVNINIGTTDIPTTITSEPYDLSFYLFADGVWNDITEEIQKSYLIVAGFLHIYTSSAGALVGVKLKILY
jgi:hypothetical protein